MAGQKRAAKGGELGANGEWYEGGKFLNTIAGNAKKEGSSPKAKPRKQQVSAGVYEVTDRRPLFSIVGTGGICDWNTGRISPYMPACRDGVFYNGQTLEEVAAICDAFNSGKMFYDEM